MKSTIKWSKKAGGLYKKYVFDDFKQAISFVNKVAAYAERINHHPDLTIKYNNVAVYLKTHDADKITKKDVDSAKHYDDLVN